jgi:hypothetical protein
MAMPKVESASNAIAPKVKAAQAKVSNDLMPKAASTMSTAVERSRPVRAEAKARGKAAWRALRGDYSTAEVEKGKSHKLRNTALAVGGVGATAAAAGYAATKRSRGPEWMRDGSEEPFPTAEEPVPEAASTADMPASESPDGSASIASSATTSESERSKGRRTPRATADKAGASPDEALADEAETASGASQT